MPGFLPWMSTTALKNVLILLQKVQLISQHDKNAFKQGKFFMQFYHQLEEIKIKKKKVIGQILTTNSEFVVY